MNRYVIAIDDDEVSIYNIFIYDANRKSEREIGKKEKRERSEGIGDKIQYYLYL